MRQPKLTYSSQVLGASNYTYAEAAAIRALSCDVRSYKSVKSILDHGLDKVPLKDEKSPALTLPMHPNIRRSDYYN